MSSVVPLYLPPPPGVNFLATIEVSYTFVLLCLPLASILVPVLLLILFFSTPTSRRTLLFALNIVTVLLGIVEGILSTIVQSILILHPQHPVSNHLFLAYIGIALYTPIIVDCILILRLSAVYPASITSRVNRITILAVPLLCTAARITCVTLFVRQWAILGYQSSAVMASGIVWPRNPMIISDWSIQLFESSYCSILFLCRLRGQKSFSSRMYRQQSVVARLRAVFYIAISNFVFPSILNIFQLTYVIHDHSVSHGAIVLMVNNYTSIIGVVFCTLWSTGDVWKGTHAGGSPYGRYTRNSALRQSAITLSGIAPNLTTSPTEDRGSLVFASVASHSVSFHHGSTPFSSSDGFGNDHKEMVSDANLAQTVNSDAPADYLQTIALHRIPADLDMDLSIDSHSPITPHDGRAIINTSAKNGTTWRATLASPRDFHPLDNGPHLEPDATSAFSESQVGIEFATPSPPPSHRHYVRRSHSLSDSSDYRSREHVRHRDHAASEIRVSTSLPFVGHEHRHNSDTNVAHYSRQLHPHLENEQRLGSFLNDDARPSFPRACRPSLWDCSDAEHGGSTLSWDGRSLDEP